MLCRNENTDTTHSEIYSIVSYSCLIKFFCQQTLNLEVSYKSLKINVYIKNHT